MRTARLWKDPRTGIWKPRRRIPTRYRAVAGRQGDVIKISTGTTDRKVAERALPDVLRRWNEMLAEWDRQLHTVTLTPEKAREITAGWAAWIATGARLETDSIQASVFNLLVSAPDSSIFGPVWARVEHHADEALGPVVNSAKLSRRRDGWRPGSCGRYCRSGWRSPGSGGFWCSIRGASARSLAPSRVSLAPALC